MTRDEVYTELIGSGYGPASIEDMLVEAYGIADILSYINTDVDSEVGGLDNLILKAESISDILGLPSVDLLPFFWDTAKPKVSPNSRPDPEWSYAGALPDGAGGLDSSGDPVVHDEGVWCGPGYTNEFQTAPTAAEIVTLLSADYTLVMTGSGSVSSSYGSATEGSPLQFTATAGATTFTPTDTDSWLLVQSSYVFPIIPPATSVVSAASSTGDNGLNVPMDTRMLAAFNGTLTLAALVTMGVGSDELANDTAVRSVLTPINSTLNTLYYFKGGDGRSTIVGSTDGTTFLESVSTPWARNERHLKIVQTNTAGTQFRVGNLRIGIDSSIQWSSWAAFDGSFDPLTYLRYMLNTTVPMWMRQVQLWSDGEVADSEILKLAERYGHA